MGEEADKQAALSEIRAIVERYGLGPEDVAGIFDEGDERPSARSGLLSRILAILGGIFVFSGIAVFVSLNWAAMNSAERVVVTLGSGLVTFVLALIADSESRYRRAAPSLFVVAAFLQPVGLLVAIDEFSSGGDWHYAAMSVAAVMALQQGAVFWSKRQSVLLFTLTFFALWFLGTAFDWLNVDEEVIAVILGASTVGYCAGLDRTRFAGITPFWYFAASIGFYSGLYELIEGTIVELAFLAVSSAGVFLSAVVRSRTLLTISTIAILAYIAEFTADHFADSLGWPIVLVLIGIFLIVLSGFAMRVNRKYISVTGNR